MTPGALEAWVFDLDNTLYPAPALYDAIGARMTAFIADVLDVDAAAAQDLRDRYFHEDGATVAGLARRHGVDAHAFLEYVHDVDYGVLSPDPELAALIAALPGRKLVFTNGSAGHGDKALKRLGLAGLFEQVFDIEAAGLIPKPQVGAYTRLMEACAIDPQRAVLIEDTMRNLEPAHALGFATGLVGPVHPEPRPDYVHRWARDLKALLRGWD